MAKRKKPSFWDEKKLRELVKIYPKKSPQFLEDYYGKTYFQISDAYHFAVKHKRFFKEYRIENKIRVTVYHAARAEGSINIRDPFW